MKSKYNIVRSTNDYDHHEVLGSNLSRDDAQKALRKLSWENHNRIVGENQNWLTLSDLTTGHPITYTIVWNGFAIENKILNKLFKTIAHPITVMAVILIVAAVILILKLQQHGK